MAGKKRQESVGRGEVVKPETGHTQAEDGMHGHDHPAHHAGDAAPVAHHFNNLLQQQATVRFGMWLFLVTEVLFFGGAFCAYTVCRILYPKDFEAGSAALNVGIASVNTFLLLASSLTITLATRACYVGSRSMLKFWLGITIILGTLFLGLKMREYQIDYEEGLIPTGSSIVVNDISEMQTFNLDGTIKVIEVETPVSRPAFGENVRHVLSEPVIADVLKAQNFDLRGVNFARVQLFFMFYYVMTGLHVVHMIIGLGLLGWQFTLTHFGFFKYPARHVYIEAMSLYWHFVDMVWMFLLPLLYLAGPHSFGQAVEQFKFAIGLASH